MKKLLIEINSLNFTIKILDSSMYPVIKQVCSRLTSHTLVFDKRTKRYYKDEDKSFYTFDPNERIYRFPITILRDLLGTLGSNKISKDDIEFINNTTASYGAHVIKTTPNKKYVLRDYQEECLRLLNDNYKKKLMLLDLATGMGKAQWVKTPVKTPDGWTEIGKLKVGDKVLTKNGTYTAVTGVYPQGVKQLYRITFYDGRSTLCCKEHLWELIIRDGAPKRYKKVVKNTEYILNYMKGKLPSNSRIYVPVVEPTKEKDKKFLIHPYILGCIIGDGSITVRRIAISLYDAEIVERIKTLVPEGYSINSYDRLEPSTGRIKKLTTITYEEPLCNPMVDELDRLGLIGKTSLEKHIPEEYLAGSYNQRLELIRGLMDTDGTVSDPAKSKGRNGCSSKCGSLSFSTSSFHMVPGLLELFRSVGCIASYYIKIPYYTHNGQRLRGNLNYIFNIRSKKPKKLVYRSFLRNRLTDDNQYSKNFKLRINKIEEVDKREAVCISVEDHSSLYVCNDYIVTHNTVIMSRFIGDHKTRAMFLLLPKYIEKWKKDLREYLNIEEDEIYVIQGDESLINLMEEQDLEYKIIIFSLTSLTYYLKNYELKTVEYPVAPQNLMQHLNVGLLVNDETHQHFHAIMRAVSYFNTSFMVCSSATLDSNNTTMKNLYKLLVPYGNRISNLTEYKPYTDMYVVTYNMVITKAIKYKRAKGYNHILYEQSLLNNSYLLNKYYEMVYFYLDKYYFKKRQPEDKLAIFFASIDMCNSFTNYMKEKHSDESIYRYIGGDDYGTMLNSNIIITNQGMLGTGIDIKNLTMVFQTVSMGSLQANLQNFGRLRKIEGKDTSYFYIYCRDIQNHRKLSKERFEALKDRCKSIYYLQYHTELRS